MREMELAFSVPLPWMVRLPLALEPTSTPWAAAPGAPMMVGLGLMVLILASTAPFGTPPIQFPAVNQSLEAAPVQSAADDSVVMPTRPSATREVVHARRRPIG